MLKTTPSTTRQPILDKPIYTIAQVEAAAAAPATLPIWIRLPRNKERCKYTSLSRSAMNAIILGKNPPVRSVSLKQRYAVRGQRLIHLQSLLDYIEGVAEAQGNQPEKGGEQDA